MQKSAAAPEGVPVFLAFLGSHQQGHQSNGYLPLSLLTLVSPSCQSGERGIFLLFAEELTKVVKDHRSECFCFKLIFIGVLLLYRVLVSAAQAECMWHNTPASFLVQSALGQSRHEFCGGSRPSLVPCFLISSPYILLSPSLPIHPTPPFPLDVIRLLSAVDHR